MKNGEVDLLYGATELSYDYFQLQSTDGMMEPIVFNSARIGDYSYNG